MTTSTIELMRESARQTADASGPAAHLRRLHEEELAQRAHDDPPGTIHTPDGITIIPEPPGPETRLRAPGTRLSAEVIGRHDHLSQARLRPMHPQSVPEGMTRTLRYFSLLRKRPHDPETFHRFVAADAIVELRDLVQLRGARALDIGGQAGYMADALRDEGTSCLVVEHPCDALDPHDGKLDRVVCSEGDALPLADRSFDLVYSSEVLGHVATPHRLLDEVARILVPGTGIGYVAFTNRRSLLARYSPAGRHDGVSVGEVLTWFSNRDDVELITADPRYLPEWASRVLSVPGVREVATGTLRVVFRARA